MDTNTGSNHAIPSLDEQVKEYDSYYRGSLELWDHPVRTESTIRILDMYYRGAGGGSPSSVLDVGCGTGEVLQALRERWPGIRLAGLDLSEIAIAAARRRLPSAELKQGALGHTDFSERFDLIILLGTLEHIPDTAAALRDLSGLVADGGIIYIEVPDNISRDYSEKVEGFRRLNGHNRQVEWHLYRGSWEGRIRDSGLEIVLPIEGPYYGGEFIWIASNRKHRVARRWVRAIRDFSMAHTYRWTPSPLDRLKMGIRRMIGSGAYDGIKAKLRGG